MMRKIAINVLIWTLTVLFPMAVALAEPGKDSNSVSPKTCENPQTTVCTIEIWLVHQQSRQDKEIREYLKSKSIKVLRNTIQYWKPSGGHPPTNIVIGGGLSAEDARMVIDFALKHNDSVDFLIPERLNPPNYAAVGTSAWDENSQIPVTPENLKRLMDPKLTTEEFHAFYIQLTGERKLPEKFN